VVDNRKFLGPGPQLSNVFSSSCGVNAQERVQFSGRAMAEAACEWACSGGALEYTAADAEWLRVHQHRKVLDARVIIVGVAARRQPSMQPAVLKCYPMRVTGQASAEDGTHKNRREVRCRTKRKWTDDEPVPWPNLYWLVDPLLSQRVGKLESAGLVQEWQREIAHDERFAAGLAAAHREYAVTRWATLDDDDREYCLSRESFVGVLRDFGVGGLRFDNQIKCLHAQLAHYLAGGRNPVGARVWRMLQAEDLDHGVARGESVSRKVKEHSLTSAAPARAGGAAACPSASSCGEMPSTRGQTETPEQGDH
jgi:hypothetical protein